MFHTGCDLCFFFTQLSESLNHWVKSKPVDLCRDATLGACDMRQAKPECVENCLSGTLLSGDSTKINGALLCLLESITVDSASPGVGTRRPDMGTTGVHRRPYPKLRVHFSRVSSQPRLSLWQKRHGYWRLACVPVRLQKLLWCVDKDDAQAELCG